MRPYEETNPERMVLEDIYNIVPQWLKDDTLFGRRQYYEAIIDLLKTMRASLFDEERQLYYQQYERVPGEFCLQDEGFVLLTLIECYEIMPEESYDQFRYIGSLYKEALKGVIRYQDSETGLFYEQDRLDPVGSGMIADSVIKACRLGLLQREKYMEGNLWSSISSSCQQDEPLSN